MLGRYWRQEAGEEGGGLSGAAGCAYFKCPNWALRFAPDVASDRVFMKAV